MEKRLNKKVEDYILEFKEHLKEKVVESSLKDFESSGIDCSDYKEFINLQGYAWIRFSGARLTDEKLIDGIISVGAKANFNVLHSCLIESWCQTPGQSPIFETYIMGERY